jgi:hypothetical protein
VVLVVEEVSESQQVETALGAALPDISLIEACVSITTYQI